jgi:hypothetical protein
MGRETVEHLVIWCSKPPNLGPGRNQKSDLGDLHKVLHGEYRGNKSGIAETVVDWLLGSSRLPEYRLASKLDMGQCLTQSASAAMGLYCRGELRSRSHQISVSYRLVFHPAMGGLQRQFSYEHSGRGSDTPKGISE